LELAELLDYEPLIDGREDGLGDRGDDEAGAMMIRSRRCTWYAAELTTTAGRFLVPV
jgi:hypothetical protein